MLNVTSLREQVYLYLREQMHTGALMPGSTINPTELSEHLGISKTPLRDALIRLESEGFVEILPRRGVRVNQVTLEDVKAFYEIIGHLEAGAILAAFDRMGPATIRVLEKLNLEMRAAVTSGDFDTYYDKNLDFHEVYLQLHHNKHLRRMIRPLKQRLYDFPRRSYIKEWELNNCDEHQEFIDRVMGNDPEGAASVMRDVHWSYKVQEEYIRRFYHKLEEQMQAEQAQGR
jgi:DNA-binding GntR family transcriptional regulator